MMVSEFSRIPLQDYMRHREGLASDSHFVGRPAAGMFEIMSETAPSQSDAPLILPVPMLPAVGPQAVASTPEPARRISSRPAAKGRRRSDLNSPNLRLMSSNRVRRAIAAAWCYRYFCSWPLAPRPSWRAFTIGFPSRPMLPGSLEFVTAGPTD